MTRLTLGALSTVLGLMFWSGCEGDVDRPDNKPKIEVKETPDLDSLTDHDVDVKVPDVDVDVTREEGELPDVDVDVLEPADKDTKADEDDPAGADR